nr:MAG TPA: hypothetical protein [Caudoviricetes sp.]
MVCSQARPLHNKRFSVIRINKVVRASWHVNVVALFLSFLTTC